MSSEQTLTRSQGRGRRLGRRAGVSRCCIHRHIAAVQARWKASTATTRWDAETQRLHTIGVKGVDIGAESTFLYQERVGNGILQTTLRVMNGE